ncbi:MAG: hypothetical protein WC783_00480 [Candidatus Paceibacterota bacterium]|jgi:hypothetical protein
MNRENLYFKGIDLRKSAFEKKASSEIETIKRLVREELLLRKSDVSKPKKVDFLNVIKRDENQI